jgi:hypothetical protein
MSDDDVGDIIARTLENAARAPYYARAWGDRWRGIRSIEGMAALPLLDKSTAIANQRDLIVGEAPAGFGIASSGTTRSADLPALNVLRSEEENALLFGDAATASGAIEDDPNDPHPGWTLVVVGVHHGLPPRPPARGELRVPWMYHRNALSMIEACIERPQPDGRRVTAMRISAGALKTVTAWFLERGRDVASYGVKMIGTNGSRVSAHWRALIASTWGAELYDNFSLSEVPTPATECKACGALHFSWPPLLYEVLDLHSGAQLPDGDALGRLVVTPLAPFVHKMPLVRYDTGDVVDVRGTCEATGQPCITYLGRARRGIVVGGTPTAFVLSPAFVQDVLEALPDTERNPHPAVTNGLVKTRELGLPRFTVERDDDVVRLRFEARFDPRVYEKRTRALADEVGAQLLLLDRALAACVRERRIALDVVVHAPGSLDPPGDKSE